MCVLPLATRDASRARVVGQQGAMEEAMTVTTSEGTFCLQRILKASGEGEVKGPRSGAVASSNDGGGGGARGIT